MRNPFIIPKKHLDRLFLWQKPDLSKLYLIEKRTIALWMFYLGMLLVYFTSLTPWFLWPLQRFYPPIACLPIVASMLMSLHIKESLFTRKDFFMPTVSMSLLLLMMAISSGRNINGIFMVVFNTIVFMSLFKANIPEIRKFGDVIATFMASLLAVSIPFYVLYLLGFPLPHSTIDGFDYTFDNYLFFLVDHRFNWELIPRFHSVFIEPAQLGMACVTLLYAQAGKWNTWRCRILFLALAMTFSLAAYLCAIVMFFSVSWMKGKAVLGKILFLIGIVFTVGIGSIFYNRGENMINQLIVSRVMLDENGEMEGNNRTTDLFTREYEKLFSSGEIIIGKGNEDLAKFGFGNSGYRVFIYCYGMVSVACLIVLFYALIRTSTNKRAALSMLIIHCLSFWAHGIPHRPYLFISLYILLFSTVYPPKHYIELKRQGDDSGE